MLLGDFLLALRSFFEQLKARRLAVLELPFATLFLSLEVLDKVHDRRPTTRLDSSIPCRANYTLCYKYSNSVAECTRGCKLKYHDGPLEYAQLHSGDQSDLTI